VVRLVGTNQAMADPQHQGKSDPEREKLAQLGDEIEAARRQAEHDGLIDTDEDKYVDSGARPEDDDQTIAPG
jgi:hypothetical protein